MFLISPRRYGKSSLIGQALRALRRQRIPAVALTVISFSSYVAVLEGYAGVLLGLERETARARSWLARLAGVARPVVRAVGPAAGWRGSLDVAFPGVRTPRDIARLADEIFALPGRIAEARGGRLVIALDEFQDVARFDGGAVEQALRAAVQQQRQVATCSPGPSRGSWSA